MYRARWWLWRQLIAAAFFVAPRDEHRRQMLLNLNRMEDEND